MQVELRRNRDETNTEARETKASKKKQKNFEDAYRNADKWREGLKQKAENYLC